MTAHRTHGTNHISTDTEPVPAAVTGFIGKHSLLKEGEKILVGVSGGPDSMLLLTLLHRNAARYRIKLRAAHLNHRLRGAAADGDEKLVRAYCKKLGVPLVVLRKNVRETAKRFRLSLEDAARRERRAFFENVARKHRIGTLALAHTADDEVETFLMRLLRGAGGRGLGGIFPKRRIGRLIVIRPLLPLWKRAVLTYADRYNIPYRVDRSNLSDLFLRNRIRNRLIPYLRTRYNPNVKEIVRRAAESIRREHDFIASYAHGRLNAIVKRRSSDRVIIPIAKLFKEHPAVRIEIVKGGISSLSPLTVLSYTDIASIDGLCRKEKGMKIHELRNGLRITKEYQTLVISRTGDEHEEDIPEFPLTNGAVSSGHGFTLRFALSIRKKPKDWRTPKKRRSFGALWKEGEKRNWSLTEYFSWDLLEKKKLTVRSRRPGDRYVPAGMTGAKSIKRIMIDEKVPSTVRSLIPLVVCGKDILWPIGYRIAEKYKVTPATRRLLELRVEKS
jgi:tRNA(Ile)-lysidine synthase